jgi:hypothetical protein
MTEDVTDLILVSCTRDKADNVLENHPNLHQNLTLYVMNKIHKPVFNSVLSIRFSLKYPLDSRLTFY